MRQSCNYMYRCVQTHPIAYFILFVIQWVRMSAVDIIGNVCDVWLMNLILTGTQHLLIQIYMYMYPRKGKLLSSTVAKAMRIEIVNRQQKEEYEAHHMNNLVCIAWKTAKLNFLFEWTCENEYAFAVLINLWR